MSKEGYRRGDFWRICDRTGFKVRASDTVKEWTGLIVHRDHADKRNEQDFVRARHDRQSVPDPRPEYTGERMRMDITHITIDNTEIPIDQQGDRFLDTNEVQSSDL